MYTTSGHELAAADLPRTGYCQYCGIAGAHVELFRPEGAPWQGGTITFRARAYYVCGRAHFETAVREEARSEIHEQFETQTRTLGTPGCAGGGQDSAAARAELR